MGRREEERARGVSARKLAAASSSRATSIGHSRALEKQLPAAAVQRPGRTESEQSFVSARAPRPRK
jgi:hypothetical protein